MKASLFGRETATQHETLPAQTAKTLPFDATKIKTLAVIGPNAADIHLGGYSAVPMRGVSVLQGITEYSKGKFKVLYAEGCKLTVNKDCNWQVNENPIWTVRKTIKN